MKYYAEKGIVIKVKRVCFSVYSLENNISVTREHLRPLSFLARLYLCKLESHHKLLFTSLLLLHKQLNIPISYLKKCTRSRSCIRRQEKNCSKLNTPPLIRKRIRVSNPVALQYFSRILYIKQRLICLIKVKVIVFSKLSMNELQSC